MKLDLDDAMAVLSRTPKTLSALLLELPDNWVTGQEGPETWSPYNVIGHLIHGEKADWIPRARIILEHGESRPFDAFDRFAQFEESRGKTLEALLEEFTRARAASLEALRALKLSAADLKKTGQHPALGRVTLAQLIATWVAHDLDHVTQVARVMAKQYADQVGPWSEYLSVLHDRVK